MTHEEFVKLLEEERGAFILEDLTEHYKEAFFRDY
jgi:hypothetical protein